MLKRNFSPRYWSKGQVFRFENGFSATFWTQMQASVAQHIGRAAFFRAESQETMEGLTRFGQKTKKGGRLGRPVNLSESVHSLFRISFLLPASLQELWFVLEAWWSRPAMRRAFLP